MIKNYPRLLKEISDPPPVLYVKGELPKSSRVIAVVGTRKITNYGKEVTEILVKDLVNAEFTLS
ncbi:DNA-processing protein DprA [Patescibacteria group bacterium]|nr:DNA-processing protein DprA [Patescibacteria group bacterium]